MTDPGNTADRLSAEWGGPCFQCGGSGGGGVLANGLILPPCTGCHGTGRVNRPAPTWLSNWRCDGETVEMAESLIATGLGAQDEHTMLSAALDVRDPGPKCYLREGPDIRLLGDRPLAHYDMTGRCQDHHPHVTWDAASPNIDEGILRRLAAGIGCPRRQLVRR